MHRSLLHISLIGVFLSAGCTSQPDALKERLALAQYNELAQTLDPQSRATLADLKRRAEKYTTHGLLQVELLPAGGTVYVDGEELSAIQARQAEQGVRSYLKDDAIVTKQYRRTPKAVFLLPGTRTIRAVWADGRELTVTVDLPVALERAVWAVSEHRSANDSITRGFTFSDKPVNKVTLILKLPPI